MVIIPLGDSLEGLLKKEIVKSGDGLTLGLSTSMMKFFTMEGPFIGMLHDCMVSSVLSLVPPHLLKILLNYCKLLSAFVSYNNLRAVYLNFTVSSLYSGLL